jgi:hypothetical protein
MRRSFGLASTVAITISTLLAVLVPGVASASPSDPTIYPINCASSGRVNVYLEYGISSITITNPDGCGGSPTFYISEGKTSTWTYSQTISSTTTSGVYDPDAIPNFETGAIGAADSFTLTLTSAASSSLTFSGGGITLDIFFNKQFSTLNPDPVAIGQQVTVTGSNLSAVTSLSFSGPVSFSVTTENRSATQLSFNVPSIFVSRFGNVTVTPGTYRLRSSANLQGKTLTLVAAPVVASISSDELARRNAQAASVQREAVKRNARAEILVQHRNSESILLELFAQAEIVGITKENNEAVQAEIAVLPEESREDLALIIKIARKYEVVDIVASERVKTIYSNSLIEIGLIPEESKYKATLTRLVKELSQNERSSYASIKEAIDAEIAVNQAKEDRLTKILALIASRRNG